MLFPRNHSTPDLTYNIGFCFLKPDYTNIADQFGVDLADNGLSIIHEGSLTLSSRVIDYIYSDSQGEDFYPDMKRGLGAQAVHAMVVYKPDGMVDLDAQSTLESLKRGTNGYPNLRERYHRREHQVSDADLELWRGKILEPVEQSDLTFRLTQQNVFHAADGPHDAIGTLLRLRSDESQSSQSYFDAAEDPRTLKVIDSLDKINERHYREVDMSGITRKWRVINEPPEINGPEPVRQVYTWLLTADEEVVVVSKDDVNWQLPGGKPDPGENASQVAVREVVEETGIDIGSLQDDLHFFGAYTIHDSAPQDGNPAVYQQVRAWLRLPETADQLDLSTSGESTTQRPEDAVRFAKTVSARNISKIIPWMPQADEFKYLKRNKII